MRCHFCGNEVDTSDPNHYKQVVVWVGGPKKNSAKLSVDTGLVAHAACINDAARGVAPDQDPLPL